MHLSFWFHEISIKLRQRERERDCSSLILVYKRKGDSDLEKVGQTTRVGAGAGVQC